MFIRNTTSWTLIALVLVGCAKNSENIDAVYVSPVQYENMTCKRIGEEAGRVSTRVAQVSDLQDKQANNDSGAVAISLILFWPAAFFVKGNKANAAELARLKGEFSALEQASISKHCNIVFHPPVADPQTAENAAPSR